MNRRGAKLPPLARMPPGSDYDREALRAKFRRLFGDDDGLEPALVRPRDGGGLGGGASVSPGEADRPHAAR